MNNIKFNSLEEWRDSYPKDYEYSRKKKMLPFICEKMGWELPTNNVLISFNKLKETKLIDMYNVFLEIEKDFNIIKIKKNNDSATRFRVNFRNLKKSLIILKRDISSIK
jgi:hypothetical protein